MKTLILICALACSTCFGQALPNAPKANVLDLSLDLADVTIRTMDLIETNALVNNPCKCVVEYDPIAPSGKTIPPELIFQYGWSAAFIFTHRELLKHNHPRWARALMAGDIVVESVTVVRNMTMVYPKK